MIGSMIGRRDFFKLGAGAAATIGMLNGVTVSAQAPPRRKECRGGRRDPGRGSG